MVHLLSTLTVSVTSSQTLSTHICAPTTFEAVLYKVTYGLTIGPGWLPGTPEWEELREARIKRHRAWVETVSKTTRTNDLFVVPTINLKAG